MDRRAEVNCGGRSRSNSFQELELAVHSLNVNPGEHTGWGTTGAVEYFNDVETTSESYDLLTTGQELSHGPFVDGDNSTQQVLNGSFAQENWSLNSASSQSYSTYALAPLEETLVFPDWWDQPFDVIQNPAMSPWSSCLPLSQTPQALTPPQPPGCACHGACHRPISRNPITSRQPRARPASRALKCKYGNCSVVSTSVKDRNRHHLQVHEKPEPGALRLGWYACRCWHQTSRKDDLKRHLKTCKKEPERIEYVCSCLTPFICRRIFEEHIQVCGAKSKGRPRQTSLSPVADSMYG